MSVVFERLLERVATARVICVGLSALDQIWTVDDGFSGGGQKIRAGLFETAGGGMAATAAVAVSRLGASAAFWGRGGDDPAGHLMRDGLAAAGVDVAQFRLFPGGRSSVSGIVVDRHGERQIANFRGTFPEAADWLPLGTVAAAGAVLADPRWVEGAATAFAAARAAGVPTVLDADMAERDVFEHLLPLTDHAVFSEPALRAFGGDDLDAALADAARFGPVVTAVTRGAAGVAWLEGGRRFDRPSFAVAAVDTTGAGDVFHGAYALAIGARLPVAEAMRFAAAAAALKCTRPGGRAGIPTLPDTLALIRTTP